MNQTIPTPVEHPECRLCAILQGGVGDAFNSVWLSGTTYKALISVGAMVRGWTLICPVKHDVNLAASYGTSSFHDFVDDALHHLKKRYGRCAVFEHGARQENSLTGCGVGHAHLHLVPLDFPLAKEALRSAPELNWRNCAMSDVDASTRGSEYLFVADDYCGAHTTGLIARLQTPTSQFFRRVIANRIGMAEFFDYRKYPMLELATASAAELRGDVSTPIGA